jgi:small subunit ribosomal protein S16
MIRLRFQRLGSKRNPFYRLVATDKRNKRDGRFNELLGTYNPMVEPNVIDVNVERIDWWLSRGAELSESAKIVVDRARKSEGMTVIAFEQKMRERRATERAQALQARTVDQVASQAPAPAPAAASTDND